MLRNEIIRLEISGMTNEGNGVGKHEALLFSCLLLLLATLSNAG